MIRCLSIIILIVVSLVASFPDDIPRCHAGDTACITRTAQALLKTHAKTGYPSLGFPVVEPFFLKHFEIGDGRNQGNINLKLKFKDVTVSGLSDVKIENTVGFTEDPTTSKFEMFYTFSKINIKGKYVADGRILILPIQGDGDSEINLINTKAAIKFKPKVTKKDGRLFLDVDKLKVYLDPERMQIKLTNLFNGDKALGSNLNIFLNENWKDVWTELQPSIHSAIAEVMKSIMKNIFIKFSYEELFLE
ncbi:hypothetical protein ACFFRR_000072 [Megaselia abdita]